MLARSSQKGTLWATPGLWKLGLGAGQGLEARVKGEPPRKGPNFTHSPRRQCDVLMGDESPGPGVLAPPPVA